MITRQMPGPWAAQAECRDTFGKHHFPRGPQHSPEYRQDVALAKAMCAVCTVRQECLDLAIANRETDGVWGGYLFPRGVKAHRRRLAQSAAD